MRILHIISNMRPDSGGPQEAVRMMLRSAPADCTSEVVTLDDPSATSLPNEPFTLHALGNWRRLTPWLRTNRDRFDGIVLHGMWESLSLSLLRAVAGRTPYVVYPHGMLDPYFKRAFPLKHLKKWLYWLPIQYWVMRRALRVVFTTAAERDFATQSFWLHRWTAAVIPLGAATPPADLIRCQKAFFATHPALRRSPYLLFLGRIDAKKGCDALVTAFARISAKNPSLHLVMAGPDPTNWHSDLQAIAVKAGVTQRIRWPGMLSGDAKWGALAAADAFILPSHQENFGIAVVESLACGTPALLTHPINIAADLAADHSALVEPDTLEGTQRLLARWLALTSEEQAAMRTNALRSVATRYDMRKNTAALIDLFAPPAQQQETPQA